MADEESYEEQHVHSVYNQIANHFSSTRYKPWPVVDDFLRTLSPGSIGLDIGCGNGKYLQVNKDVFIVGSDRSDALTKIASQHQPHTAIVADILSLPHPKNNFDFAICIAVIHHLSTRERRILGVRAILETLRPASAIISPGESPGGNGGQELRKESGVNGNAKVEGKDKKSGQALIFVWALEQKNSRRGWDVGDQQDQLVPWVLKDRSKTKPQSGGQLAQQDGEINGEEEVEGKREEQKTFQRYYHLYRQRELEEDVETAGGMVVRNGYDRDNWQASSIEKDYLSALATLPLPKSCKSTGD